MIKHLKNIFFVFNFLCQVISPQTENIKFEHLSIEQGLSQSTVECILQDKTGFMWFGTNDGLNKYDGYTFTTFRYDPLDKNSISDNYIYDLVEDSTGYIWVVTNYGLNRFDPVTEKFIRYFHIPNDKNSISDNIVHSIEIDQTGRIWIATLNGGLNVYSYYKDIFITVIPVYQNEVVKMISNISIVDQKYLCIGTFYGEAYRADISGLNTGNNKPVSLNMMKINIHINNESDKENIIWGFNKDSSGNLWICTNRTGLIKYDPLTSSSVRYSNELTGKFFLSDNSVHRIFINSTNELWVGTESGGLNILYPGQESFISIVSNSENPDGLNDNGVWSIFEDSFGSMWCGTEFGGINRYDPGRLRFRHYLTKNIIITNQIWSLFEDHNEIIWIGTDGEGLVSFDIKKNIYENYPALPKNPYGLSYNIISVILEDNEKNLWVCTDGGGLNRFNRNNKSFKRFIHDPKDEETISNNSIKSACRSKDGKIWIGSYGGGISLFNPETGKAKRFFGEEDSIKIPDADFAYALLEDDGILWIGTYGSGLISYEITTREYEIFKNSESDLSSLSNDKVASLLKDSKGQLWVGTSRGLNLFNSEKRSFTVYTIKDGLPNNVIYSILEDQEGFLWLSTNKGLSRFDPVNKKFKSFTVKDGLQAYEFNRGASFSLKNGDLIFGGINGFNLISPHSVELESFSPKVVFTSFRIMNQETGFGITPYYLEEVELSYNQNSLTFEFAALDFTSSGENEYAYTLEGLNEEWIYSGKNRTASFAHLEPGEYTLKVKASDSYGNWNENYAQIKILINPPFWQTWWFRFIIIILVISILYSVYSYRLKKVLEIERLRIRIASDLHDDIGSSLTRIAMNSELILEDVSKDNSKNLLKDIGEKSREIITTMGDVVWSIDARNDSVKNLLDRMKEFCTALLGTKNISVSFEHNITEFEKKLPVDIRQNIYLIFKEGINNVAKHSNASEVKIVLLNDSKKFEMAIRDNGTLNKVSKKTGHGLRNMKMRAEKIGGEIKIKNEDGFEVFFTGKI